MVGSYDCIPAQPKVTFAVDGLEGCGFVSVAGSWDDFSGLGVDGSNGYQLSLDEGVYSFVVLCVDTAVEEWRDDIWGASTIVRPDFDECAANESAFEVVVLGNDHSQTKTICAVVGSIACDGPCLAPSPPPPLLPLQPSQPCPPLAALAEISNDELYSIWCTGGDVTTL